MRIFITGIDGFVGKHLAQLLCEKGHQVSGVGLLPHISFECDYFQGDITDQKLLTELFLLKKPDVIFHLAAIAFVPHAERAPQKAIQTNIFGSVVVLQSAVQTLPGVRVIIISSGEVYGKISLEALPITESTPVKPANLYAATKASSELFAGVYAQKKTVKSIILRTFNHIGPGQSASFVTSDFARQIARIEQNLQKPQISVGNLEAKRDFTDVRDVVRAYLLAAEQGIPGEVYNIASNESVSIANILDILLSFSSEEIEIHIDTSRLRKTDTPEVRSSYEKFRKATGWTPHIQLKQSLKDILNYWREEVKGE